MIRAGKTTVLAENASAVTWQDGAILVASNTQIIPFDAAGQAGAAIDAEYGATAMARIGAWLVLGFSDGNLTLIPTRRGGGRPTATRSRTSPGSPVIRLVMSPMHTVIVGYESRLVGIWSLENGTRLRWAKLHGPITRLQIGADDKLYVGTELGGELVLDLAIFHMPYCELVKSVWNKVPVVWEGGLPVSRPAPLDHRCAR